jgi:hypothetical protein
MTISELEAIRKTIEQSSNRNLFIFFVILLVALSVNIIIQYFTEKAKGYATKQDIGKITKSVEDVKAEVKKTHDIEKSKIDLKYNTLLKSLKLIDAFTSNFWLNAPGIIIDKQYASIEEFRDCHNQLILTCDNGELVNIFYKLMFPTSKILGDQMRSLSHYRNLVRSELGFGENSMILDEDKIWFASVNSKKPD